MVPFTEMHDRTAIPTTLPLENGDLLSRAEFEHHYHAMPHLKKAELIEGVVYRPPGICQAVSVWTIVTITPHLKNHTYACGDQNNQIQ